MLVHDAEDAVFQRQGNDARDEGLFAARRKGQLLFKFLPRQLFGKLALHGLHHVRKGDGAARQRQDDRQVGKEIQGRLGAEDGPQIHRDKDADGPFCAVAGLSLIHISVKPLRVTVVGSVAV